jgi:hypothetical protein
MRAWLTPSVFASASSVTLCVARLDAAGPGMPFGAADGLERLDANGDELAVTVVRAQAAATGVDGFLRAEAPRVSGLSPSSR